MSNEAKKRLYVGGEGSGKTTLALHEARKEKHLLILDLNRQESLAKGSHVVIALSRAVDAKRALLDAMRGLDRRKKYHVTWQVPTSINPREALDFSIRVLQSIGGMAILIDETETFIPVRVKLSDKVKFMAKRARHMSPMPLYMTAQKPTELHDVIRNNVYSMSFFRPRDRPAMNFFFDQVALYWNAKEARNILKNMKDYHFVHVVDGKPPEKKLPIRKKT